jgi:hypothetical protein
MELIRFENPSHRRFESLLAAEGRPADTVGENAEGIVKPIKPKDLRLEDIFYECLALLGVLAMTAVLAIAMRVGEGKW